MIDAVNICDEMGDTRLKKLARVALSPNALRQVGHRDLEAVCFQILASATRGLTKI